MTLQDGDRVLHWAHGEGTVLRAEPEFDEVPWEWRHDWDSVVLAAFIWKGRVNHVWVVREDLDLLEEE